MRFSNHRDLLLWATATRVRSTNTASLEWRHFRHFTRSSRFPQRNKRAINRSTLSEVGAPSPHWTQGRTHQLRTLVSHARALLKRAALSEQSGGTFCPGFAKSTRSFPSLSLTSATTFLRGISKSSLGLLCRWSAHSQLSRRISQVCVSSGNLCNFIWQPSRRLTLWRKKKNEIKAFVYLLTYRRLARGLRTKTGYVPNSTSEKNAFEFNLCWNGRTLSEPWAPLSYLNEETWHRHFYQSKYDP